MSVGRSRMSTLMEESIDFLKNPDVDYKSTINYYVEVADRSFADLYKNELPPIENLISTWKELRMIAEILSDDIDGYDTEIYELVKQLINTGNEKAIAYAMANYPDECRRFVKINFTNEV